MHPNDIPILLLAFACGGLLGFLFFGGLWWTVRRGLASPKPALWFFASLMARMSVVLIGFYVVGDGHWQRLVACLFGFFTARLAVTRMTFSSARSLAMEPPDASDA